jgi:hypothetical protein
MVAVNLKNLEVSEDQILLNQHNSLYNNRIYEMQ